ncbi:hypothetical protein J1605_021736 [Eschrichtius robustus]|uniref:Peptidase S1 domain-containing protein n=1 Tax=Eschrichtius robustus TaxID=9764 RepID=A0AB34HEX7_ESCRO|nr:hypothetical protein J1605_021736 [Eschrichtius robustus]
MMAAHLSIQHPEYNRPSLANDLMLIKLEELWPTAGFSCLVSGWGRLANGRLPKVLQCVNISVVSKEICSELYGPVYHPSMFCAGGGQDQKDSCHGDSGGPLSATGVYTNLCKFTDWIQKTIQAS